MKPLSLRPAAAEELAAEEPQPAAAAEDAAALLQPALIAAEAISHLSYCTVMMKHELSAISSRP